MSATEDARLGTSGLLADLAQNGDGETIAIGAIMNRFRSRAYGVLLVLVLLPAFIPLPTGTGAISGSLVSLVGLQMLLIRRRPWLPIRAQQYNIKRSSLGRFARRMQRVLGPLERACKPRLIGLTRHWLALFSTGLQLFILGILLALPIPLTNYPFALLLMLYAIATVERDGALMLVAWVLGVATIVTTIILSHEIIAFLQSLAA